VQYGTAQYGTVQYSTVVVRYGPVRWHTWKGRKERSPDLMTFFTSTARESIPRIVSLSKSSMWRKWVGPLADVAPGAALTSVATARAALRRRRAGTPPRGTPGAPGAFLTFLAPKGEALAQEGVASEAQGLRRGRGCPEGGTALHGSVLTECTDVRGSDTWHLGRREGRQGARARAGLGRVGSRAKRGELFCRSPTDVLTLCEWECVGESSRVGRGTAVARYRPPRQGALRTSST